MAQYVKLEGLNVSDYVTVCDCECSDFGSQTVMAVDDLHYLPTVDAVEVVRCKDCKYHREAHYEEEGEPPYIKHVCEMFKSRPIQVQLDDYCCWGRRKEGKV